MRLLDGTGGGGTVEALIELGRTYVPWNPGWDEVVANLGRVPVVAAALGGWRVAARSGAVDVVVDNEDEALAFVRRVLAYLPPNAWTLPPRGEATDPADRCDEALRSAVPRDRRAPYDMRAVLASVCDAGSVVELGRAFAPATITALARLAGYPVAVLASDPRVYGGGLTADGSDKLARFVDLADTFGLPVVHLVDQPGFVIGSVAERSGAIRRGARAVAAVYQSRVPWASVLVRRVFGVAGAAHRPHHRYTFRVAWPSGDWGSLPIEGGLEVAFRRRLAAAGEDEARVRAEIAARLEAVRDPLRTAAAFGVEDVIDPAETRPLLCEWVREAYAALATEPRGPHPTARP